MLVTKPILMEHVDPKLAADIVLKAIKYNITTQINGRNSNGHRQVLTRFSLSSLIEKMEDHIKTMREDLAAKNKLTIKKLKNINTILQKKRQTNV